MVTHNVAVKTGLDKEAATRLYMTRMALIALFGGAVAIAFAPIFVRLSQVGPSATAFWRLSLALPALALWTALEQRAPQAPRRPSSGMEYWQLAAAGLFFAGDLAFWHWSIRFTSVANATLLANFAPIFVTLGAWSLLGQRVQRAFLLGMGVALLGTILIVGVSFRLSWQRLLGDGLGLVTAVFYAGYILAVKNLRNVFSAATIMTWSGVVSSAALLPVALLLGERLLPAGLQGWIILAGLALLSQVLGQGLIAYALAHLPAAFSSVSLLVQPVMASVFAWLILNEALGAWQALGGVLVLVGIFLARRAS